MQSYRLRHRITIQSPVNTQDTTTGENIVTWVDFLKDEPAEVLTGQGREFNQSASQQAETAARINMRWQPDVLTTMRVLWDGNVYNIHSIETDITARRELRLVCTAGVNEG